MPSDEHTDSKSTFAKTYDFTESSKDVLMANPDDTRQPVTKEQIELVLTMALEHLKAQMHRKGNGSFVHRHEVLGCVQEEFYELIEAAHNRDSAHMKEELYDLLEACAFGIASLEVMPERR